ncbi:TraR/DksA family transcriptional regulator [Providencia rustigianii]|uniref:Phage/conjugal plasmid C-4 type zinc finger protein, TraR family n=1 Tax=Providencia rustigianii DSM 4541 TaxID=500637 RepID=D1NZ04_9GAMM|nr:TraR/DksA family transcriptional regulator [Providencia rustigianii]EFB73702.1 phage/conjugal plasmid C-4 type zinc finger protein, TraR family [Providencia rustigianii DSM 4541]MTC61000.1 TraR/DksA family transcriptional regulator [Providencia rustigianii]SUC26963.1 DnaK suppressor protein [Providencia rustigianii]VEH55415.1 DnaK suppressor protein [Providencia rustigianii]
MSDVIDRANDHAALVLEQHIEAARKPVNSVSAFECENCDHPIPEARRQAVMGCTLCIDCQILSELKDKHYRSV